MAAAAGDDSQRTAWLYRIAANELASHFRRGFSERRALSSIGGDLRALSDSEYEHQSILRVRRSPFLPRREAVRGFVYYSDTHRVCAQDS